MNIRRLRSYWLFFVVAREGSFSVAARTLHMTQPPLSMQIAELEEELGVKLFERTPRGVRLTLHGKGLLPLCEKLFRQIEGFEGALNGVVQGVAGTIRIGAIPWITQSVLPGLVSHIRLLYPGMQIKVKQLVSSQMPGGLLGNEVDLCLGYLSSATRDDLELVPIKKYELVVVMPSWHPLTQYQQVSLLSLKNEDYVITDWRNAPEYHDAVVSQCLEKGLSLKISTIAGSVFSQLCYVNCGMGIALIPRACLSTLPPNVRYRELKEKVYLVLKCITRKQDESPVVAEAKRYLEGL
ncbi:MAG: LysR family transcriptional regulator [Mesosutterella sp.]|nr:LysR family transcriptional regulator [Mesosutterella sp.]